MDHVTLDTYERPGRYQAQHAVSRGTADRRIRPGTLRALLRWAHQQYVAETPNLDHSGSHIDDDGAPTMAAAARRYLALTAQPCKLTGHPDADIARKHRPCVGEPACLFEGADDWLRIASRTDKDGFYLTPLRRAIESLPIERRLYLRDLVPELFFPSDVAMLHGIPPWCQSDVTYRSLVMLWDRFVDRPLPQPGWLERSDSQRAAETVA